VGESPFFIQLDEGPKPEHYAIGMREKDVIINHGPSIGNNGLTRIFIPWTNQEAINWYGPYNGQGVGDPPHVREPIADITTSVPQEAQSIAGPPTSSVIPQTITSADKPMSSASQPTLAEAGKDLPPDFSSSSL
jgi:hypothetical protein